MNDFFGFAQLDISRNGTLVYGKGKENRRLRTLAWLESNGRTRPLRAEPANYGQLRFAPDGKRLATVRGEGANADVWVYEPERDIMARLTSAPGQDWCPVWTPDGQHLAFASDRHGGISNLYWIRADGAGDAVRLTESKQQQSPGSFSPDGKVLAFSQDDGIWTVSLDDAAKDHPKAGKPEPFLQTQSGVDTWPAISPDGRWLAYASDESGRAEIYVKPFPGPGGKWLVSNGVQGGPPVWSKKTGELFYATSEGIIAVSYRANGATFEAARPRMWMLKKDPGFFDVAPDGKHVAVFLTDESIQKDAKTPTQVTFLLNFFDELRRRAPAGGK
jgi:serine/threonine-protein kinase